MSNPIIDGIINALILIFTGDPETWQVIFLSLRVSGLAVAFATMLGVPIGVIVGLRNFFGKNLVISLINTLMGLPPVVVGLIIFLLISRSGPLGALGLLYTPTAIMIGQIIIATPIIAGVTLAGVSAIDISVIETAKSLGATGTQTWGLVVREARVNILSGVAVGFGQSISEVGASMILGGNIEGFTRVMTTDIVLQTSQGNYGQAIALGLILIIIAFIINSLVLTRLQLKSKKLAGRKIMSTSIPPY
ncbi:MAG: ABC transporter permease [Candidatus Odinarchaeum yellowstonii]|uniref:ABC transporter permease n=1 Tax=Odinarchaeota yellowstonii (strain LCB_4) TaxID=1841599 RepID=A0AAF0D390_ODILC|nr:MAG: ABC transporter permease [Candidatus Odinarchaeum yellowstonii]